MFKITTWNVNSIRMRESHVADFLAREQPDCLLLQELKCESSQFPTLAFKALGYEAVVVGQKAYNGVAILYRGTAELLHRSLPDLPDDPQARFIEIRTQKLRVGGLYLPNGNSGGEDGYAYKLRWMEALRQHAATLIDQDEDFILAGDYNVCPTDVDFAPRALQATDALARPQTRSAYHALLNTGLTEATRALHPHDDTLYTFWDYQAGAWNLNNGLRIDHALLSPRLADRLATVTIHKDERAKPQPSDHVPVSVILEDA